MRIVCISCPKWIKRVLRTTKKGLKAVFTNEEKD